MPLSSADDIRWVVATSLRVLLCLILLRNRTHRRIPIFSAYIYLGVPRSLLLWWMYHDPQAEAGLVFNAYWVTQLVMVAARGFAVAEICWLVLHEHRGVWGLTWRLLAAVGVCLATLAMLSALGDTSWVAAVTLRGERGLELTIIAVLVTLFSLCRYYGVRIEPAVKYVAIGLGFYASVQAINNSVVHVWTETFESSWRVIRSLSFDAAVLVWCWGLRKPIPATSSPQELEPGVYEQLAPQVSYRLRQLNDRLLEMLK